MWSTLPVNCGVDEIFLDIVDLERDRRRCVDDEVVWLVEELVISTQSAHIWHEAEIDLVFPCWVFLQHLLSLVLGSNCGRHINTELPPCQLHVSPIVLHRTLTSTNCATMWDAMKPFPPDIRTDCLFPAIVRMV